MDGGKHAERIQRDVPPGRADPVGRAAGRRSRASTIDPSGFTMIRSARMSAAACSPNVTTRPARDAQRMGAQALEIGVVAVEHRRAARLQPVERFRPWRRRCPRCEGKNSIWTGSTVVIDAPHAGAPCAVSGQDLARMVHADLEHAVFGVPRHARKCQRHAPMIVVGGDRCVRRALSRQREAHRLLGAGLADRARDRDDPRRPCARARAMPRPRMASSTSGTTTSRSGPCEAGSSLLATRRRPPLPCRAPPATKSWPSCTSPLMAKNRSPGCKRARVDGDAGRRLDSSAPTPPRRSRLRSRRVSRGACSSAALSAMAARTSS